MEEINAISWPQRREAVIERLEGIRLNLQNCFVNPSFDAQFELSKLSQVGSVLDYQIEFENLSNKATETPELILVSLFISGLKSEIRWELQLNRPFTLKEAFILAQFHESRLEDLRLVRNKVVDELTYSNATRETEEYGDMLPGCEESRATEIVETIQTEEIEEVMNATQSSQSQTDLPLPMDHPQVNQIQGLICHVPTAQALTNQPTCMYVRVRSTFVPAASFQLSSSQRRERWHRDDLWIDSSYKMSKLIFGIFFLNVARRGIALKLYALKEVYQKSFDFHLEDKVDLKESGMIRP